ncbi:MAG TPA: ATP-binding cassette domain-containing protein, partial [Gammaproteobacteria bacterium]|nr:ATP-binding cassette domain-containing protein [Gammaproteobacteria bacterium]
NAAVSAIVTRGLTKHYGHIEALRGIDLQVERGEMFALLGPNGAGKTTLFSILSTLRRPSGGEARVLGHDVVSDRARIRRAMGVVFQEPALERRLSVRDNLFLMGLFYGLPLRKARARAGEIMEALGLTNIAGRRAEDLSGGQKRHLELARSMVPRPDILFLDEATLGLDVDARRSFWAQVREFARAGHTVFFTTHYMEEAEVADRIALISDGRILALDTPSALKQRIGGGVILLSTEDDSVAQAWLLEHGYAVESSERGLMLVGDDPAALLPALLGALPVKTRRAEIHEPSLEDVFLTLTGRALSANERVSGQDRPNAGAAP